MTAIDPSQIPGESPRLDPDAVEAAARALRGDAESIRETGSEVVGAWSRLRADYQAPESEQLLRSMDPVRSTTTTLGDDLERVAAALMTFAAELREVKAKFDGVRADAVAFRDRIRSNPEWEYDQALIDENTALLGRVNSTQVRLWDAERECANAIRAVDDIKRWHSGVAEGDQYGYGLSSIPEGTEMPWGAPVDKQEHCPMSAAIAVKSAVWDGFAIDVVWEGFKGLGGLIGLGEDGFTMETFQSTWGGMGALIGRDAATGDWAWGTAGDAWLETGKSLVAWDMWDDDPARATGTALGNIALTVATLGTGAAIKGVASAGRAGQVLSVAGQTLRVIGKAMDPVELLVGGAKVLKGVRLMDTFEAARFHSLLNMDEILKGLEFDPNVDMTTPEPDGLDAPLAENSASHGTSDEAGQSAGEAQPPTGEAESISGGHTGPRDIALREIWSEDAYDEIREASDDATRIAADLSNLSMPDGTTITPDDLTAIKEHVFLTEHELTYGDGTVAIKRFDAIPEQAEAWFRLQDGRALPSDRLWLLHEKTELEYLRDNPGSTYREAHSAANRVADWAREVGLS